MIKAKPSAPSGASGHAATPPTYRQNPDVDAKIDAYIKENPKYWAYVQEMPRERLERTTVLNEVRELERQQRMKEGILKQVNQSPTLKAAYETLVKELPEDQREDVIAQLARQAKRAFGRSQSQQQVRSQTVGAA